MLVESCDRCRGCYNTFVGIRITATAAYGNNITLSLSLSGKSEKINLSLKRRHSENHQIRIDVMYRQPNGLLAAHPDSSTMRICVDTMQKFIMG